MAGHVLGERAAAGQGEDVQAAADGEERHARVEGGAHQGELEAVPALVGLVGLLVPLLVVQDRIDVPAPGEHQAVDRTSTKAATEAGGTGGTHQRRATGAFHRPDVADRQDRCLPQPVTPAGRVKFPRNANDRAAHPRSSCPQR